MNYENIVSEEFQNTCIRITEPSFDGEDSIGLYHRSTIGDAFEYAEDSDVFCRISNNYEGTLEQLGSGIGVRIHFGDVEIADQFQEVLAKVGDIKISDYRDVL